MTVKYQKMTVVVTGVAKGTPIALNTSPCLGNASRQFVARIPVLPLSTSTTLIETAPRVDPLTGQAPAAGSASWTTLLSPTSTSDQIFECSPDYWVRYNCTVAHADPNFEVFFEGVQ
jgi:hypothetical protein